MCYGRGGWAAVSTVYELAGRDFQMVQSAWKFDAE